MNQEKQRIVAELPIRSVSNTRLWLPGFIAVAAMLGVVTAFGTAPDTTTLNLHQTDFTEPLRIAPESLSVSEPALFVREEKIRQGDTIAMLLHRLGVTASVTQSQLQATAGASAIFRQLSPGKIITARITREGGLHSMTFPLNGNQGRVLSIRRNSDDTFEIVEKSLPVDVQVALKSGEIRYSLFGATDTADIPDSIATQLADIFGGEIDFHRDLRRGDRFSVVYEMLNANGKPVRAGRILAAEFINAGKQFKAVWYGDDKQGGYYTPDGRSLKKAFLRSPLEFSRITSGFTTARLHPVLNQWRAHKGVDYAAAIGTRVRSTADGIVEYVGTQGGYGKVVILRHQGRYSTLYGHLSSFASTIKKGTRISQGEIIGFSGATGLASGPHLHYEFRIDGVHKNPLTIAIPETPPLEAHQLSAFHSSTSHELARLDMIRGYDLSALD